jgi:hypothetical protein
VRPIPIGASDSPSSRRWGAHGRSTSIASSRRSPIPNGACDAKRRGRCGAAGTRHFADWRTCSRRELRSRAAPLRGRCRASARTRSCPRARSPTEEDVRLEAIAAVAARQDGRLAGGGATAVPGVAPIGGRAAGGAGTPWRSSTRRRSGPERSPGPLTPEPPLHRRRPPGAGPQAHGAAEPARRSRRAEGGGAPILPSAARRDRRDLHADERSRARRGPSGAPASWPRSPILNATMRIAAVVAPTARREMRRQAAARPARPQSARRPYGAARPRAARRRRHRMPVPRRPGARDPDAARQALGPSASARFRRRSDGHGLVRGPASRAASLRGVRGGRSVATPISRACSRTRT